MLRLAFDFIITWRETRTRPNAYGSDAETVRGNGLFHGHQPFHQGGRVHEQKDGCRILQQEQQWSGGLPVPYPGDPVQIEYG